MIKAVLHLKKQDVYKVKPVYECNKAKKNAVWI